MKQPFRMPTKKDMLAFKRGEAAFRRGAAFIDNPMTDDDEALLWGFGWYSAHTDAKKSKRLKAPVAMHAGQSRSDNKAAFVRLLVRAGWSRKEASAEYERETS